MAKKSETPARHLEIYVNYDLGVGDNIQRIVWEGTEVPFKINSLEVTYDSYGSNTQIVHCFLERGGKLTLYPSTMEYFDETPPKPSCPTCGQPLKSSSGE